MSRKEWDRWGAISGVRGSKRERGERGERGRRGERGDNRQILTHTRTPSRKKNLTLFIYLSNWRGFSSPKVSSRAAEYLSKTA